MTPETVITFITGYLHSLREESRQETSGAKHGFDHIILKLAEADDLIPLRIAYHRPGREGMPKPKKEHEYGEDLKVISRDGKHLTIFVLKDEALTYRNWTEEGFEKDMTLASSQDMTLPEMGLVTEVKIILAYNKDDEARGVEAFDRFVKSRPRKIGESATLTFERWNLTSLTEKVRDKLIGSPALLPEQFFRSFSYLCWQVQDFAHGSEQWREVLMPDVKEFLANVLSGNPGEKEVRMVSVALLILHDHGKKHPTWETGWIEILECAMLALWLMARKAKSDKILQEVLRTWLGLYVVQLEAFYEKNGEKLMVEDSLSCGPHREFADAVASHHAYWHIARLGILGLSFLQLASAMPQKRESEAMVEAYQKVMHILAGMLSANSACRRPMLDIHHIQLCLVWFLFAVSHRNDEILNLFADIQERLVLRRRDGITARLLDQSNSWSLLLESIASGENSSPAVGRSSYLLQMLIEICVYRLGKEGEELAWAIYQHLIQGCTIDGHSFEFPEKVELQSWIPPDDWIDKILAGSIGHEGTCVTINYFASSKPNEEEFPAAVRLFIETTQASAPEVEYRGLPLAVIALACETHRSPLPPAFWRSSFGEPEGKTKKRKSTGRKKADASPTGR